MRQGENNASLFQCAAGNKICTTFARKEVGSSQSNKWRTKVFRNEEGWRCQWKSPIKSIYPVSTSSTSRPHGCQWRPTRVLVATALHPIQPNPTQPRYTGSWMVARPRRWWAFCLNVREADEVQRLDVLPATILFLVSSPVAAHVEMLTGVKRPKSGRPWGVMYVSVGGGGPGLALHCHMMDGKGRSDFTLTKRTCCHCCPDPPPHHWELVLMRVVRGNHVIEVI